MKVDDVDQEVDVVTCSRPPCPDTSNNQESPRSATLRKRKTVKKSASQIWQHVTEDEMALVSLPAASCRTINGRMKQRRFNQDRSTPDSKRQSGSPNDGFSVKTGVVSLYHGQVRFVNLYEHPTTLCPSPEDHVIRVFQMKQELPLACPTCWSVQRNSG